MTGHAWRLALRLLLVVGTAFASPLTMAAIGCSITASPGTFTGIYGNAANLDVQGAFTINCTRDPATDPRRPDIWIGFNQAATGNSMTRDIGGSTLQYFVYRRAAGSGVWTNTGSQKTNQSGTAGLLDTIDFGNAGATYSGSYTVYFRVPLGQVLVPAGIYLDSNVGVTMKLTDENGPTLATTGLGFRISIPKDCRFSTDPSPISVSYAAFRTTALTGTSNFALTCTQGTNYTLTLDRTRSIIPTVLLAYTLALSTPSGTGTAVAQPFAVDISIPPGQAGSCTTGTCSGTDVRTITITY